jgi:hypothetical protein
VHWISIRENLVSCLFTSRVLWYKGSGSKIYVGAEVGLALTTLSRLVLSTTACQEGITRYHLRIQIRKGFVCSPHAVSVLVDWISARACLYQFLRCLVKGVVKERCIFIRIALIVGLLVGSFFRTRVCFGEGIFRIVRHNWVAKGLAFGTTFDALLTAAVAGREREAVLSVFVALIAPAGHSVAYDVIQVGSSVETCFRWAEIERDLRVF